MLTRKPVGSIWSGVSVSNRYDAMVSGMVAFKIELEDEKYFYGEI